MGPSANSRVNGETNGEMNGEMNGETNGHIPNLNVLEKILQSVSQLNTFTKELFSDDVTADVPASDPQALHAGILGDLASQATRVPEDLGDLIGFIETATHGGITDDRKFLVGARPSEN